MSGLSPDQLALRRRGITATDIAAIAGFHPQRSSIDVWLEKTGQAEPFDETARTRWGQILETPIRDDYEHRHGVRVEVPGTIVHPRHPWWMATPDGLAYHRGAVHPDRGVEIKCHGFDAVVFGGLEYGAPGTDEVPLHELAQCVWGMGATGLSRWDLIVFLNNSPTEYIIDRDDELLGMLAERGAKFWTDHVKAGVPPDPDGSPSWDNWIARRWPKNAADLISIDDKPEVRADVAALRAARASEADAENEVERLTQILKVAIGDKAGLTWREPSRAKPCNITWRWAKAATSTNWQTSFEEAKTSAGLFASAKDSELETAIRALRAHSGEIGNGEIVTASAENIADLLDLAVTTLRAIAEKEPRQQANNPGRPFNVPRWWKTSKEK